MSINASANRLSALTNDLAVKWALVKEHWTDQKCQEFERKYMNELFSGVNVAVASCKELEKVIAKIRRDCE